MTATTMNGPEPVAFHWDRYVSACRLLWRGDDVSHLEPELVHNATWANRTLKENGMNPFKHLRLCGEERIQDGS